jgi:hypothetical protein
MYVNVQFVLTFKFVSQDSTGHKTQNKDKQNKSNTENWNDEEHGPYQKRFITHLT